MNLSDSYDDDSLLRWEAYQRFSDLLGKSSTLPILFIGSGLSQRFLGTPGWNQLIQQMCQTVGQNPKYVISGVNGDLADAATKLSSLFHEAWWHEDRFANNREKYGSIQHSLESPLKCEVVECFPGKEVNPDREPHIQAEVDLLSEAKIAGAITTNYDFLVENIFSQFKVYVGQSSMLLSNPLGVAEIYKIHGCCSDPNSIVLTQGDYEKYQANNPYLMAKLLSIFVEHPIVFLGYSIQDANIKSILRAIGSIAQANEQLDLTDKIIFVEWDRAGGDPSFSDHPYWIDDVAIPITRLKVPDFLGVFRELSSAKERLPMRVIRQFQSHIYEIVKGRIPTERITVMNLEEVSDYDQVEWAVGIGVKSALADKGLVGVSRNDVIRDFLREEPSFNADQVIESILPRLSARGIQYVPVYRYLGLASSVSENEGGQYPAEVNELIGRYLRTDLNEFRPRSNSRGAHLRRWDDHGPNLHDVVESTSFSNGMTTLSVLVPEIVNLGELRKFLIESQDKAFNGESCDSSWAKLVAQLDFLEFGPGAEGPTD